MNFQRSFIRLFCYILLIFSVVTTIAKATFSNQLLPQNLEVKQTRNCLIRSAIPIQIQYNDYVNQNCIHSKIRVNEPFGFYTLRDGSIKWETLFQASDCLVNHFHHSRCNITTSLPSIQRSLELNIWRNCSWNYARIENDTLLLR